MIHSILQMMAGLFLTITVISPLISIDIPDISEFFASFEIDASQYVSQGADSVNTQVILLIKEQTQAYILDEATKLGADIIADVEIGDESLPRPIAVTIKGTISPFARQKLSQVITNDLGILKENQTWS